MAGQPTNFVPATRVQSAAEAWRRVQVRQLFRLALEALLIGSFWRSAKAPSPQRLWSPIFLPNAPLALIGAPRRNGWSPAALPQLARSSSSPENEKVIRMNAHTARIEAGCLHVPQRAPELLTFPQCRHDDQIDALSQALDRATLFFLLRIMAYEKHNEVINVIFFVIA